MSKAIDSRMELHPRQKIPGGLWRRLGWLLLGVLISGPVLSQGFDARLERTQISEGESVMLLLSASGDDTGTPDLSPLDADFDVVGQSQGTSISIINGHSTQTRQWQIALMPKHPGDLRIPSLSLGNQSSQPLQLKVLPASADNNSSSAASGRPVILEVEAEPADPYVQAQVNYRVRVMARVPLREATLSEPKAGDAIIESLGEDRNYTTQRNGETWQVVERRYAIFPQHSGELTIESPLLSASVPVSTGRSRQQRGFSHDPFADIERMMGRNPFSGMGGMFEETRPMRVRDHDITLQIRPQPASTQNMSWLPAKNLTLSETWSPDPPVFRVGEPVTRSVTLVAEGLSSAQLPDPTPPVPANIKSYPDQPQSESHVEGDDLVATKTIKTALIPNASGTLTLPELRIPWWDTRTQESRVATLPARTITVLPGVAGAAQPVPTPAVPSSQPITPPPVTASANETASSTSTPISNSGSPNSNHAGIWPWVAAIMTLAWLATLFLWLRARRAITRTGLEPTDRPEQATTARQATLAQAMKRLKQACQENDAKAARAALLDWSVAYWPENRPRGLAALAQRIKDAKARNQLSTLDRVLYDETSSGWDGQTAWLILNPVLSADLTGTEKKSRGSALPELYPQPG